MSNVCELCNKNVNALLKTNVKDGIICAECKKKITSMCGKHKYDSVEIAQYREIFNHPRKAEKIKKILDIEENGCCVCGEEKTNKTTKDGKKICDKCLSNIKMFEGNIESNLEEISDKFTSSYFIDNLDECYNPNSILSINYKTNKIYIQEGHIKKKNVLIDFDDIVGCKVYSKNNEFLNKTVRYIELNYRYENSISRITIDDTIDVNYKFEKTLDCLLQIPQTELKDKVNIEGNIISEECLGTLDIGQETNANMDKIVCPKCNGENCVPISETTTSGKDFSLGKGCCGVVLLGPLGILCGLCGEKKQIKNTTYWVCSNCGNKFKKEL